MEELDCIAAVKNQANRASKTQGLDSKVRVILAFVKRQQLFRVVRESVGSQVSDGQTELRVPETRFYLLKSSECT